MAIKIIKASGLIENFDENKVAFSLHQAGVSIAGVAKVMAFLNTKLQDNMTTNQMHDMVKNYLQEHEMIVQATNYGLKRAVMLLGPSGYPFEKFFARILNLKGYRTEVGTIISGRCVKHEVDIDAQKENLHYLVECKFHNAPGNKTDIQAALYTYARFLDIRAALTEQAEHQSQFHQCWLVTNTKVSKDAVDYAKCLNINLISWTYPHHGNLREMILESRLHPVTSLNLGQREQTLIQRGIVTCSDLGDALKSNQVSDIFSNKERDDLLDRIKTISV
ncbi:restriction endonuclease [Candidatus Curtissbacteria bacterium]|nr:restriction endonuclease [Candidatus Curtissbacteria bacterium]